MIKIKSTHIYACHPRGFIVVKKRISIDWIKIWSQKNNFVYEDKYFQGNIKTAVSEILNLYGDWLTLTSRLTHYIIELFINLMFENTCDLIILMMSLKIKIIIPVFSYQSSL